MKNSLAFLENCIQHGSHVLKALALTAKPALVVTWYLYALTAAGQAVFERVLGNLRAEIGSEKRYEAPWHHLHQ